MRSPRLPWYPWFTGEWLTETRGWSLVQRGLYRELLDAQWDRGILPASPKELRAIAGASAAEWRQAWPRVSAHFPRVVGGRLNARLELRRKEQEALHARRRAGAERTNRARWGSLSDSVADTPETRHAIAERQKGNINSRKDSPQRRDGTYRKAGPLQ